MNDQPETVNIPAYKRKRSIAAKAKKTEIKLRKPRKKTARRKHKPIEMPLMDELHTVDLFEDEITRAKTGRKVREFKKCGICEGYFEKIDVAIIKLTSPLRTSDTILIANDYGLFEQEVKSMQIDRKEVKIARTGSDIGIKIRKTPKVGTAVYKLI
jgi:hypothetical protein